MKIDDMKLNHFYREHIAHGGGADDSQLTDILTSSVAAAQKYEFTPEDKEQKAEYFTLEELNHTPGTRWEYIGETLSK